MDMLKKVTDKAQGNAGQQSIAQKEDYGDKAFNYVDNKYMGNKLDDSKTEGYTDKIRETFEKQTGKNVPDKVSN
ncbi:Uu.00g147230.m01.CDS01 [Anthostomella pinea]|uniref:Uu.00g147230.m01.CDS01 n=1 Tax=Anthostomella pinea TaxID=933095 RepID=A0AAI8VRE9_9PEZI|nr:Uu.00g147230.m01.CDS01 [Anthostomella pinea]